MDAPDTTENSTVSNQWKPLRWKDVESDKMKIISTVVNILPELPVHVHKILKIVSDIDSEAKEIAQLASSDPVLITRILNTVNSSYYGFSKKIDDLHLAIVLLGYAEIRALAVQSVFSPSLGKGNVYKSYDTRNLWIHSYQVSVCSEAILGEKGHELIGVFLTLGLLHDIGKFVLYNIAIMMVKQGIKLPGLEGLSPDACIMEKEERLFGVNHAIVGGMIARKWGLSEKITSVIEYHHYPSFFEMNEIPLEYLKDITTICMADLITNSISNFSGIHHRSKASLLKISGKRLKKPKAF